MSLAQIVSVSISISSRTPTAEGFGVPLIAGYHNLYPDRVRAYQSLTGLVSDGFTPDHPIYLAAESILSAEPSVAEFMVGRRASAWTQVVDLTPASPSTGKLYSWTIDGRALTYTALVSDALADVCTAIASASNAVNSASVTAILATGGASTAGPQTITGAALNGAIGLRNMTPALAGSMTYSSSASWDASTVVTWTGTDSNGNVVTDTFAVLHSSAGTTYGTKGVHFATVTEIDVPTQLGTAGTFTAGTRARFTADGSSTTKVVVTTTLGGDMVPYAMTSFTSNITLLDATADSGIASDLNAIYLANTGWYGLTLDSNGAAEIAAAAAWVEANGQCIFAAQTCDTAVTDTAASSDLASIAYTLQSKGYARTHLDFHPTIGSNFIAAAILGNQLPTIPGSSDWSFKELPGVASYTLTANQETNCQAKNVGTYEVVAGLAITQGGLDSAGEYMDVIVFRDWVVNSMQIAVFTLLVNNPKVPYTDKGAALIGGELLRVLKEGVTNGGLDSDPAPVVNIPSVASISPAVRQTRVLPNVTFSAKLAGAIHAVTINGSLSP